ncbi:peroxisome assembly protein 26-like [Lineus longissimus]|uniref:peroxisome assembly protein 26-like n=1 Tax=Lineus longissimus TaxID=88925 RepID=UPI002B4CC4AC
MEVEVANVRDVTTLSVPNFSSDVDKAQDLLLFRHFLECLNVCQKSIRVAKTYPELESATQAIEDLCVLAIQAYAELNRWQEVLPFINQVYEGIENCPPIIIQVCLLLYAKVRDFTTCHAITTVWLKRSQNHGKVGYDRVVEIVLAKVLIPQNKWTDISGFIDSCNLTSEQKRQYVGIAKEHHTEHQAKKLADEKGTMEDSGPTTEGRVAYNNGQVRGSQNDANNMFKHYLERFRRFIVRNIPVANLRTARYVALMGLSVYMIFYATHSDMVGNMTSIAIFWQGMTNLWKRMFSPYHVSRNA